MSSEEFNKELRKLNIELKSNYKISLKSIDHISIRNGDFASIYVKFDTECLKEEEFTIIASEENARLRILLLNKSSKPSYLGLKKETLMKIYKLAIDNIDLIKEKELQKQLTK